MALFLVIGYALTFRELSANANPAAWGAFGDYIGGLLNPLISLFTLIVAMKVWGLQKTELLETRKAVEEQGKTAEQQRREQRFFDLLNLYQETLKTFVIEGASGKAALNNWPALSKNTRGCVDFLTIGWMEQHPDNVHNFALNSEVINSWHQFSPILDHYFRTIFSILTELENLLKEDHIRYGKLFRAQLSRDEVTLLAFNLLFDAEGVKMRSLVEKYGLLKHLSTNQLRSHAINELGPLSFGRKWAEERILTPREEIHAD